MKHQLEKYYFDVFEPIRMIEKHLQDINDFQSFQYNLLVQDAVQRRLGIIGEALWKAYKLDPSINITDINKIISFRHVLIHDYDRIEVASIWQIIKKNLIVLKEETEHLLKQGGFSVE